MQANKSLTYLENTQELVEQVRIELGITRSFTEKQIRYIELALLDNETIGKMINKEVNNKSDRVQAYCILLDTTNNVVYGYLNNYDINNVLWKLGIATFNRILPVYLNQIESGVLKGDKLAMSHARSLTQKLIDVKEKQELHLQQNNYLNVDGKSLQSIVNALKRKNDTTQSGQSEDSRSDTASQ